jgi:hypothetical protein
MAGEFEELTRHDSNVLSNTMEQTLLTLLAQYVLIAHFSRPEVVIKVIPFLNISYFYGRIAFLIGYPKYRSYGFCFTFLPAAMVIKYCWFSVIGINRFLGLE